jgi:hypothetical protein
MGRTELDVGLRLYIAVPGLRVYHERLPPCMQTAARIHVLDDISDIPLVHMMHYTVPSNSVPSDWWCNVD